MNSEATPIRISAIVAFDDDGAIGTKTGLPWHLPADLKRFRQVTWNKPILLGRATYQMIGRPLPGRANIVLTRDPRFQAEGCLVAHSLEEALELAREEARQRATDEIVIAGGAEVYRATWPLCQRVYLTQIHGRSGGSVYFPSEVASDDNWRVVAREEHDADAGNAWPMTFLILERESSPLSAGDRVDRGIGPFP